MSAPALSPRRPTGSLPDAGEWAGKINAARTSKNVRPALVLGGAYLGLAFARSLGRRGVPVFVLDSRPQEVAMSSRYSQGILMPDPVQHSAGWVEFMACAGSMLDCRPAVFAAGDPHLDVLLAGQDRLAAFYDFSVAGSAVLRLLRDKRSQYRWMMQRKVEIPRTLIPESGDEAVEGARRIGFPCIAKPAVSYRWPLRSKTKVVVLRSAAEAEAAYRVMEEAGCGCLIQETIRGGDDQFYGTLSCFSRFGRPLTTFAKRKLRQYPEGFGNGSVQISVDMPELVERSEAVLRGLGCNGFASIEYKFDAADGRMKLIEINPRMVSGLQMAVDSGCDLPWIGYRDLTGLPAEEPPGYRSGVLLVNESWELRRVLARRRLADWLEAAATVIRARSYASWSVRDPGPFSSLVKRSLCGEL